MDNNYLVAFDQMLEFMCHAYNRVGCEVFFDKISYKNVRFGVEAIIMKIRFCPMALSSKIAYLLVISSIIIIELGCESALAKTSS